MIYLISLELPGYIGLQSKSKAMRLSHERSPMQHLTSVDYRLTQFTIIIHLWYAFYYLLEVSIFYIGRMIELLEKFAKKIHTGNL